MVFAPVLMRLITPGFLERMAKRKDFAGQVAKIIADYWSLFVLTLLLSFIRLKRLNPLWWARRLTVGYYGNVRGLRRDVRIVVRGYLLAELNRYATQRMQ